MKDLKKQILEYVKSVDNKDYVAKTRTDNSTEYLFMDNKKIFTHKEITSIEQKRPLFNKKICTITENMIIRQNLFSTKLERVNSLSHPKRSIDIIVYDDKISRDKIMQIIFDKNYLN